MTLEVDRAIVLDSTDELESYILSEHIFWKVKHPNSASFFTSIPEFSLGNLLLSLARLKASREDMLAYPEFQDVVEKIENIKAHWTVNWSKKADAELQMRVRLWSGTINDLIENRSHFGLNYPYQIRMRAIIQLLIEEVLQPNKVVDIVEELDLALANLTSEADFCWEASLSRGFDLEKYWFLYRKLK
ncbi:MAG: hypothetical protein ABFD29_00815 [Anaerolineaceae bacterium]